VLPVKPAPVAVVIGANTRLDAVGTSARQYGVRPGQTLSEARALLAHLQVIALTETEVQSALERVCESILRFGTTVAYELADTVWLDITGVAHLFGGEASLCEELLSAISELGYRARLAVASGPILAQSFARWGTPLRGQVAVITAEGAESSVQQVQSLPIQALPISAEVRSWLGQLGIVTLGDLKDIPREYASHRLGEQAGAALDLVSGIDTRPLRPYCPVNLPVEQVVWDDSVNGVEPLLFALRGLTARLGARLEGRGLAAQRVRLTVNYDAGIARLRGSELTLVQEYELAAPLFRAEELWKVISSRLTRTQFSAPSVGLLLEVLQLTHAHQRQLELSQAQSSLVGATPEALAVLLGELSADIGDRQFGLLRVADSHRPEKVSLLQPITYKQISSRARNRRGVNRLESPCARAGVVTAPATPEVGTDAASMTSAEMVMNTASLSGAEVAPFKTVSSPSRLLRKPVPVHGSIRVGSLISVGRQMFTIKNTQFEQRLDFVEWWSESAVSRDYVRVWLERGGSGMEALVFVDRKTGQRFLQAIYD
jgi:protein ImuB